MQGANGSVTAFGIVGILRRREGKAFVLVLIALLVLVGAAVGGGYLHYRGVAARMTLTAEQLTTQHAPLFLTIKDPLRSAAAVFDNEFLDANPGLEITQAIHHLRQGIEEVVAGLDASGPRLREALGRGLHLSVTRLVPERKTAHGFAALDLGSHHGALASIFPGAARAELERVLATMGRVGPGSLHEHISQVLEVPQLPDFPIHVALVDNLLLFASSAETLANAVELRKIGQNSIASVDSFRRFRDHLAVGRDLGVYLRVPQWSPVVESQVQGDPAAKLVLQLAGVAGWDALVGLADFDGARLEEDVHVLLRRPLGALQLVNLESAGVAQSVRLTPTRAALSLSLAVNRPAELLWRFLDIASQAGFPWNSRAFKQGVQQFASLFGVGFDEVLDALLGGSLTVFVTEPDLKRPGGGLIKTVDRSVDHELYLERLREILRSGARATFENKEYKGFRVTEVRFDERELREFQLYYALTDGYFAATTSLDAMTAVLERVLSLRAAPTSPAGTEEKRFLQVTGRLDQLNAFVQTVEDPRVHVWSQNLGLSSLVVPEPVAALEAYVGVTPDSLRLHLTPSLLASAALITLADQMLEAYYRDSVVVVEGPGQSEATVRGMYQPHLQFEFQPQEPGLWSLTATPVGTQATYAVGGTPGGQSHWYWPRGTMSAHTLVTATDLAMRVPLRFGLRHDAPAYQATRYRVTLTRRAVEVRSPFVEEFEDAASLVGKWTDGQGNTPPVDGGSLLATPSTRCAGIAVGDAGWVLFELKAAGRGGGHQARLVLRSGEQGFPLAAVTLSRDALGAGVLAIESGHRRNVNHWQVGYRSPQVAPEAWAAWERARVQFNRASGEVTVLLFVEDAGQWRPATGLTHRLEERLWAPRRTQDLRFDLLVDAHPRATGPGELKIDRVEVFTADAGLPEEVQPPVQGQGSEAQPPPQITDSFTGMELVLVQGGAFAMGDTFGDGSPNEKPVHTVTVSDFYLGKHEVTQAQWEQVMGSNLSHFKGADRPVETVSWNGVQEFIRRLNQKTGRRYRLPTEAEWEYAARSGWAGERWGGTSSERELGEYAWYAENSGGQTQPVGRKKPNGLGLYDMSGNVFEWVQDKYGESYYREGPKQDPRGPNSGEDRVVRGGSWEDEPVNARAAFRYRAWPTSASVALGFRLALASPPQ